MATSQNGWSVIPNYGDPALTKIDHITGSVRKGDVAIVLGFVVKWFDQNIEDVDKGEDDWGYARRNISGTATVSNHASGTAVDLNATKHPQFKDTFSAADKAKIRKFLASDPLRGVVRWGGDYSARRLDQMHFEINASAAAVAAAARRIEALGGKVPSAPASKPKPSTSGKGDAGLLYEGNPKNSAARVKKLQAGLNRVFPAYSKFAGNGDGKFGPYTTKVVKEFQRRSGLKADGVVGPDTVKKLKANGINL